MIKPTRLITDTKILFCDTSCRQNDGNDQNQFLHSVKPIYRDCRTWVQLDSYRQLFEVLSVPSSRMHLLTADFEIFEVLFWRLHMPRRSNIRPKARRLFQERLKTKHTSYNNDTDFSSLFNARET